jgi:hypothetical protein
MRIESYVMWTGAVCNRVIARNAPIVSSDLPQFGTEASVLGKSPQEAIWLEDVPSSAPWSRLRWDLFVPLVLGANVVVAMLAWYVAELVMR